MPLFSEMCNPELHIPFPVIPHWPDLDVMPPQMQGKLGDAVLCWVARCPARTWSDITKRKGMSIGGAVSTCFRLS